VLEKNNKQQPTTHCLSYTFKLVGQLIFKTFHLPSSVEVPCTRASYLILLPTIYWNGDDDSAHDDHTRQYYASLTNRDYCKTNVFSLVRLKYRCMYKKGPIFPLKNAWVVVATAFFTWLQSQIHTTLHLRCSELRFNYFVHGLKKRD